MKSKETIRRKSLKDSSRGRFVLGVISILVTFCLWLYVLNSAPIEIEKKINVVYILPKGYSLATELPKEIKIHMKGPRAFLSSSFYDRQKIYINFDSPEFKGQKYFELKLDSEDIPHNMTVEVVKITPEKISVALTKKISKKVPVVVRLRSKFDKDFKLENIKVTPSEVEIEGPKDVVKIVDKIETEILDSSDLQGKKEVMVALMPLDNRLRVFNKSNGTKEAIENVKYSFILKPKKANLILKNIAIDFQVPQDLKYRPERSLVSMSVFASGGTETSMSKDDVKVIADIPRGVKGVARIHLKALLPEGVHLLQIYPEYINVVVERATHRSR